MVWEEKFKNLINKSHSDQAIWFLNAFWDEIKSDVEKIWDIVNLMIEFECGEPKLYGSKTWDKKEGNALELISDVVKGEQFLKKIGENFTCADLKNGTICLTEILMRKYKKDELSVINSSQGRSNNEKFSMAKKKFEDAKEAQEEVNKSWEILIKEETVYEEKIEEYKNQANNTKAVMKRIAQHELAQLKEKDLSPLRKAQLTLQAKLKKKKEEAEAAKKLFNELKKETDGIAFGSIWWMERELKEIQRYTPAKSEKMQVGTRIKGGFENASGKMTYYPGTIKSINADGSYNILFDDGDRRPYFNISHMELSDS